MAHSKIFYLAGFAAAAFVAHGLSGAAQAAPLFPGAASSAVSSGVERQHSGSYFHLVNDDKFTQGAERFVAKMADKALAFLADESLSEAQKKASFRKLLRRDFDMKTIGRFALGRYWRVSTAKQRKEYQKLFEAMVVDVYSSRFSEYKGQQLDVRSSRKDSEKDVTVISYAVSGEGQEIQVDWRVRFKDGRYRVIDVVVEGVSMAVTQRSDFSSVIQRGGGEVNVLLAHLRGE